jgi:hypothetical protein
MSATQVRFEETKTSYGLAEATRRLILDQHTELRRLLAMGLVQSVTVLDNWGCAHEPLRSLVALIREVLVKHLADEEALLRPWLESGPGHLRGEWLADEHARQRAEIDALCAWPEAASDLELAARFDRLARALLRDIAQEERYFLTVAKPLAGTEN